ncbi:uncharacterized protein LOC126424730 [Schistocerca serialis cubense]|uniref:uncharacterized protein LOC126424730 n=1 Tax=Schistocerca serialis cubense TaxID=2023355 RepID=UPI00214F049F|nr:uncharacterized protein LOC126424730 [Schistocerca serialis cubense]
MSPLISQQTQHHIRASGRVRATVPPRRPLAAGPLQLIRHSHKAPRDATQHGCSESDPAAVPAKGLAAHTHSTPDTQVWSWLWLWLAAGGRCWEQPRLPPTPAGAEVLMATLGGTRSHTAPFLALGRQLARRGHRVTLLSAFPPPPGQETPGVRQLNPEPLVRYVSELTRGWDLLGARARGEQPVPPWEAVRFGLQCLPVRPVPDGARSSQAPPLATGCPRASSRRSSAAAPAPRHGVQSAGRSGTQHRLSSRWKSFETISQDDWSAYCLHVEKLEREYWVKDGVMEDIIDAIVINLESDDDDDDDILSGELHGRALCAAGRWSTSVWRHLLQSSLVPVGTEPRTFWRRPALALLDGAFPDCLLALAHRLGAPHALLNTVAAHPGAASWAAASPAPFSVTPFMGLPYTDRMALPQRLLNAAYHVALRAMQVLSTKLLLEPCVRRHLGPDVPPISWLARNTSFVLQNALSPTTLPRAYFPDVAEVGCLHCRPAKPLPQDLEEFVSGSPSGFVLVSMGSGVRAANMPAELHRLLMTAFGSLPYRVLWKHEAGPGGEGVPQVPGNVMLRRWLPQQDLLGHPRLRAFVGHGGLLSVLEAGFHGAPLLALPVFCDHDANAAAARRAGFARVLQLQGLTAPALAAAVRAVATDPRYREAAYRQSVLIRDQPTPPLETAVFWTEYLLRHKGDTRHLQSAARDMAWWQLYCLDLALLVLGLPVLLWVALSRLCHLLLHSRHALAKKLKAH